jgi:hypothetical protein
LRAGRNNTLYSIPPREPAVLQICLICRKYSAIMEEILKNRSAVQVWEHFISLLLLTSHEFWLATNFTDQRLYGLQFFLHVCPK